MQDSRQVAKKGGILTELKSEDKQESGPAAAGHSLGSELRPQRTSPCWGGGWGSLESPDHSVSIQNEEVRVTIPPRQQGKSEQCAAGREVEVEVRSLVKKSKWIRCWT